MWFLRGRWGRGDEEGGVVERGGMRKVGKDTYRVSLFH